MNSFKTYTCDIIFLSFLRKLTLLQPHVINMRINVFALYATCSLRHTSKTNSLKLKDLSRVQSYLERNSLKSTTFTYRIPDEQQLSYICIGISAVIKAL